MEKGKYSEVFNLVQGMNKYEWDYFKKVVDTAFKEKASKTSIEGNDIQKSINLVRLSVPKYIREKFELNGNSNNKVITVQPRKTNAKDYLYKQLDKLNSKKYRNYDNGQLAEASLAMLEIVKYLDQEKKPKVMSGYQEQISENILNKLNDILSNKFNEDFDFEIL